MEAPKGQGDEFQVVRRGPKGGSPAPPASSPKTPGGGFKYRQGASKKPQKTGEEKLIERVDALMPEVRKSRPFQEALRLLDEAVHQCGSEAIQVAACYGIGSFERVLRSRYQLCLFLLLCEQLKPRSVRVFDPVLSQTETSFLAARGCTVDNVNDEGKSLASSPTLFFMPHCSKRLYSNLLWRNWGPNLSRLFIIGNSFSGYLLRAMKNKPGSRYVALAQPLATELALPNDPAIIDALNDTSLHFFPPKVLITAPATLWADNEEEPPDPSDQEIIYAAQTPAPAKS